MVSWWWSNRTLNLMRTVETRTAIVCCCMLLPIEESNYDYLLLRSHALRRAHSIPWIYIQTNQENFTSASYLRANELWVDLLYVWKRRQRRWNVDDVGHRCSAAVTAVVRAKQKMKHRLFEMVNSEKQTNVGCKTHFPFKIWRWWCWWVFGLMSDSCSFTSNLCSAATELSCWLIELSGGGWWELRKMLDSVAIDN